MTRSLRGTALLVASLTFGVLAAPASEADEPTRAAGELRDCHMTIGVWVEAGDRLTGYIKGPFRPALTGFAPGMPQAVVWHYACAGGRAGAQEIGPVNVSMVALDIEPPDGTITYSALLGFTHFYAVFAHTDDARLASALHEEGFRIGHVPAIEYERTEEPLDLVPNGTYHTTTRVAAPEGAYGITVAGAKEQDPPHAHDNVWWAWHDGRAVGLRMEIALLDAIDKSCKLPVGPLGCATVRAEAGTRVAAFFGAEEVAVGGLDHAQIPRVAWRIEELRHSSPR